MSTFNKFLFWSSVFFIATQIFYLGIEVGTSAALKEILRELMWLLGWICFATYFWMRVYA